MTQSSDDMDEIRRLLAGAGRTETDVSAEPGRRLRMWWDGDGRIVASASAGPAGTEVRIGDRVITGEEAAGLLSLGEYLAPPAEDDPAEWLGDDEADGPAVPTPCDRVLHDDDLSSGALPTDLLADHGPPDVTDDEVPPPPGPGQL